jgi:hypothetical protein
MKVMLKAPGTTRLIPHYDNLLSTFAFEFKLRRYMKTGLRRALAELKTTPLGVKMLKKLGNYGFENDVLMMANPELRAIWSDPSMKPFLEVGGGAGLQYQNPC